jgi:putative nucleotidyltransferase with HDIG domain
VAYAQEMRFVPDVKRLQNATEEFAELLLKEEIVSLIGIPLKAKGKILGVLDLFHRSPLEPDEEWFHFLDILAGQAAIAIDNATLFENAQRTRIEIEQAYDTTLVGWALALELRDEETEGHAERVTEMAVTVARRMGFSKEELVQVRRGALLHDIGKMGIPDSILHKPGALTQEEREIMKSHPQIAYDLLSRTPFLRKALNIPYYHHERWDGTGYPHGLKGVTIPLEARIFAVVDVWDALSSDRPYRKAWPAKKVVDHIKSESGKHFDPQVVDIFLKILEEGAY